MIYIQRAHQHSSTVSPEGGNIDWGNITNKPVVYPSTVPYIVTAFSWRNISEIGYYLGKCVSVKTIILDIVDPFISADIRIGTMQSQSLVLTNDKVYTTYRGQYESFPLIIFPQETRLYLFGQTSGEQGSGIVWIG